jgi:cbb3-type cytochrome c oxidase subunit II
MPRFEGFRSGWRGAALVAITYIHFLIFAQFAFLKRLDALGLAGARLKPIIAAMAAGGILLSLLTPRLKLRPSTALRAGLALSAAAAFLSLLPLNLAAALAVSALTGAGLGILTVTLVTHLRQWAGDRNPLLAIGLGTGIGYFACNIPAFFTAPAATQATIAGLLCLAAFCLPLAPRAGSLSLISTHAALPPATAFPRALVSFTALVWLDSAAFFIIQNTPSLKAGTWQGSLHLWLNAGLHLGAALAAVWLLRRRGLGPVLAAAFVALGGACLLLLDPHRAWAASVLYPCGVSLYSVSLVAYPSFLSNSASPFQRAQRAGWLYALAGWTGSALGIGMGQNLGHVPPLFVAAAGAAILAAPLFQVVRSRKRELAAVAVLAVAALGINRIVQAHTIQQPLTAVERGRQVYISEGCIHCHSQYVRPNTADELMWGPVQSIDAIRAQQPPLIGNRRQGPDLAQVGARRSPLWLKAHLIAPAQVSGASIMPSYAFLFRDQRGNDLVAYLASLRNLNVAAHLREEAAWRPAPATMAQASAAQGQRLYGRYCATCHTAAGATFLRWQASFSHPATDLTHGPYRTLRLDTAQDNLALQIARIAKFGIPGTDMPGHEYLPDEQIRSIALWLSQQVAQPISQQTHPRSIQEKNQ